MKKRVVAVMMAASHCRQACWPDAADRELIRIRRCTEHGGR